MFSKTTLFCAAALSCAWPLSAHAAAPAQTPTAAQTATGDAPARATYVLGPDDQIVIHALDVPDISEKAQRVDQNGDLRLPMVGRIHAAGMTLEEFEAELTKKLKVYLQDPDVTVTVTEVRKEPVSVLGAVSSSGVQQLTGPKTLIEVLSQAGGVSADAGPTVRVTRRRESGGIPLPEAVEDPTGRFSTVEINVRALLEARSPEKNIAIQPFDVISVPRAEMVYVLGEVGKPGPVPLSGGHSISVMEAVSTSGGVLKTAAPNRARILRMVAGDPKRAELNVDLQKIMQGKANDLSLAAGDILVIPDSTGKKATTRAIEAAIQIGTMIGTYGVIH